MGGVWEKKHFISAIIPCKFTLNLITNVNYYSVPGATARPINHHSVTWCSYEHYINIYTIATLFAIYFLLSECWWLDSFSSLRMFPLLLHHKCALFCNLPYGLLANYLLNPPTLIHRHCLEHLWPQYTHLSSVLYAFNMLQFQIQTLTMFSK